MEGSHMPALDTAAREQQHARVREWHTKVYVNNVAHMKAAVRCDRYGRGFGVFAAVLATFTGATWASDLATAGVPGELLRWVAAIAGLLGGVLVAISTTMNWPKRAVEHKAASGGFAKLLFAMETWRIEHPDADTPTDDVIKGWQEQLDAVEDKAPIVAWRAFRNAKRYVASQPEQTIW